jgi:primosomal protein N' (replication factor Y)
MSLFARVAVNFPQAVGTFDYGLPEDLTGRVQVGSFVKVPFGQFTVQGIVLALSGESAVQEVRPVEELLDPQPVVTRQQIALAEWLAENTLAPLALCLDLMLPPGLAQQVEMRVRAVSPAPDGGEGLSALQRGLVGLLQKHRELRGGQLARHFPYQDWRTAVRQLKDKGWVQTESYLPPIAVHPKMVRTARLACSPQEAERSMASLGKSPALLRRQTMLRFLIDEGQAVDVAWLYAVSRGTRQDLLALEERGLVITGESEVWRDPLAGLKVPPATSVILTDDQERAWTAIQEQMAPERDARTRKPVLLQGATGSGKTEVYLRAVERALALGQQAIVLVPEIGLTPQTAQRFAARFPGRLALFHSGLSMGERYDTWRRVRAGQLPVVIGPRSALFMPLGRLGLIVVDECHDDSYDQEDREPYYHAVDAALVYGQITGATVVLGSATPGTSLAYRARREGWAYIRLSTRVAADTTPGEVAQSADRRDAETTAQRTRPVGTLRLPMPSVELVDMREELRRGNRSVISTTLQEALVRCFRADQQAILFLNRRGSATFVFCRSCGYSLTCPRCGTPLTLHQAQARMICHHCGYERLVPEKCPRCASTDIAKYGLGTEGLETAVRALLPDARVLRWDADSARRKGAAELILSQFRRHQADILLGTQTLTKGHDFPLVTLVGVILADAPLNLPDYRAAERTFQLLTQVAGRAGRSSLGGLAIFQTFQPEHYAIQAAKAQDFDEFYQQETVRRRELGYPPFSRLVRLEYRHRDGARAREAALEMARRLKAWIDQEGFTETELIGPVPCYFSRLNGEYRWQILLRGPDPARLLRDKRLRDWKIEVDPASLL